MKFDSKGYPNYPTYCASLVLTGEGLSAYKEVAENAWKAVKDAPRENAMEFTRNMVAAHLKFHNAIMDLEQPENMMIAWVVDQVDWKRLAQDVIDGCEFTQVTKPF